MKIDIYAILTALSILALIGLMIYDFTTFCAASIDPVLINIEQEC